MIKFNRLIYILYYNPQLIYYFSKFLIITIINSFKFYINFELVTFYLRVKSYIIIDPIFHL